MMAADSLHVVVPLIVPSGMSFQWLPPCRRACSAGAFAPHFALPSAQPSTCRRLASNALGLRPSWRQFARSPARWLLRSSAAGRCRSASEGQRRKARQKDTAPGRVESQSAHGERSTGSFAAVPRGAQARANAGMSACFARPDTPELAGSAAMTDRRDDDFRVRPSAPTNRGKGQGQSFVSKVLKQAGKASGGKSAVRRPGTGVNGQRAGQRPGSRLGRGHTVARFAGAKLTLMSRRVTIKTLLVNQRNASPQSLAKHLRYIERDGAGRDGEPGRAYGPQTDEADLDAFKERADDDRHHFRFIVSPEDGAELDDLRTYTRHLVNRMEADLGTRLDWVAVDHWNTDNPHTHLIVRGRDDTGKDLIIAGDYIAHGFRHRAAELATEWLGPRTELEIQQTLQREVERSGGQASTAHCSARPARMAGCRSNASTNPGCNASACC